MNNTTKKKLKLFKYIVLNKKGINKVNSTSYNIKKTQIIEKLKFICILTSVVDLKPHS
jgi:hypothetical protein